MEKGPGKKLFEAIQKELGEDLPIWAEDLGVITPEVEELRDEFAFPGMKILQFAFEGLDESVYHPHNLTTTNCICYTGTHDNTRQPAGIRIFQNRRKTKSAATATATGASSVWISSGCAWAALQNMRFSRSRICYAGFFLPHEHTGSAFANWLIAMKHPLLRRIVWTG